MKRDVAEYGHWALCPHITFLAGKDNLNKKVMLAGKYVTFLLHPCPDFLAAGENWNCQFGFLRSEWSFKYMYLFNVLFMKTSCSIMVESGFSCPLASGTFFAISTGCHTFSARPVRETRTVRGCHVFSYD